MSAQRGDGSVLRNKIQTKPYHASTGCQGEAASGSISMLWLLQALRKRRYVAQIPPQEIRPPVTVMSDRNPKIYERLERSARIIYTLVDVKLKAIYASPMGKAEKARATQGTWRSFFIVKIFGAWPWVARAYNVRL